MMRTTTDSVPTQDFQPHDGFIAPATNNDQPVTSKDLPNAASRAAREHN
jgi:hypothetical protein